MAMTGYYKTFVRPRTHRPLSMLKYDPVGTVLLLPRGAWLGARWLTGRKLNATCCSSSRSGRAGSRALRCAAAAAAAVVVASCIIETWSRPIMLRNHAPSRGSLTSRLHCPPSIRGRTRMVDTRTHLPCSKLCLLRWLCRGHGVSPGGAVHSTPFQSTPLQPSPAQPGPNARKAWKARASDPRRPERLANAPESGHRRLARCDCGMISRRFFFFLLLSSSVWSLISVSDLPSALACPRNAERVQGNDG